MSVRKTISGDGHRPDRRGGLPITHPWQRAQAGRTDRKASEEVARRLVRDIVEKGLAVGARLPSEAEMLHQYQVSRESMREALRLLEVQGFISIRRGPGGGPSVRPVDPAYFARTASLYFHLAGASYREAFDAWLEWEPPLSRVAARCPDRGLVRARLEPYAEAGAPAPERSLHAAIADLCGNRVLRLVVQSIGHIVTGRAGATMYPGEADQVVTADHADIARAIIRGHGRKAEAMMREHLSRVVDHVEASCPERMDDQVIWG